MKSNWKVAITIWVAMLCATAIVYTWVNRPLRYERFGTDVAFDKQTGTLMAITYSTPFFASTAGTIFVGVLAIVAFFGLFGVWELLRTSFIAKPPKSKVQ